MHKPLGQIPRPNRAAASAVANAANHIEGMLRQNYPESDIPSDSNRFPRLGANLPTTDDSQEVVEELDPSSLNEVFQGQDEETYDGAAGGVVDGGIEYIAFYKSFRDVLRPPAPNRWGIFFIKKRCFALATDINFSTGESFADCLDSLATFLYKHELYHYKFDTHCLQMEATGGLPVYRPYRKLVASRPMTEWYEESVANSYGLKALQSKQDLIYDYLWHLVESSPGAYAGGIAKNQKSQRDQMTQQAITAFGNAGPDDWLNLIRTMIRTGTRFSTPLSSILETDTCPVYWIDWIKDRKSVLVPYTTSVAEINNDFIKRYLAGVQDHRSDHNFYRIDNGEKVKLPNPHQADLTNTEFRNIIGKAGMTSLQFYSERRRTKVWRKGVPRDPVLPPKVGRGK
jgi:hypothetical protein